MHLEDFMANVHCPFESLFLLLFSSSIVSLSCAVSNGANDMTVTINASAPITAKGSPETETLSSWDHLPYLTPHFHAHTPNQHQKQDHLEPEQRCAKFSSLNKVVTTLNRHVIYIGNRK